MSPASARPTDRRHHRTLIAPLGITTLAVIVLMSYLVWSGFQEAMDEAGTTTRNYAAILEARLDATLRRADAIVLERGRAVAVAALSKQAVSRYAREIDASLDSRLVHFMELAGLRIFDAAGDQLYTSDRANTPRTNIADRDYFRRLRDHPQAGLVFSEVVISRVTGRPSMAVARALRDNQGVFRGIMSAVIELDHFKRLFQSLEIGQKGFINLVRSDNFRIVLRHPPLAGGFNRALPPGATIRNAVSAGNKQATLEFTSARTGIEVIASYRTLERYPLYVVAALGREDVLAGWRTRTQAVGVAGLLLLALLAGLLVRHWSAEAREAQVMADLVASEERFRTLFEQAAVGVTLTESATGRIVRVNQKYADFLGYSQEEMLQQTFRDFTHPDDLPRDLAHSERIRAGDGSAFTMEKRYIRKDGSLAWGHLTVSPIRTAGGTFDHHVAVVTDITERKRREAELIAARQAAENSSLAKTRFLAAASHDLRQPIQAINLFLDALNRTTLSDGQKEISGYLSMAVRSLGELLNGLLDISKLDAGIFEPHLELTDTENVLRRIESEFAPTVPERNLHFKRFSRLQGLALHADPELLLRILRNIVGNAVKYTEHGGILVGARRRGDRGVIQVWDTGIGVAPEHMSQIFEEYFQISNPERDKTRGLGLGLAIVRRLAKLIDGEVNCRSRLGRGTVFEISLPLAGGRLSGDKSPFPSASADPGDLSGVMGRRIVVIEDDVLVAKAIVQSLEALGMEVTAFNDADDALASLKIADADFYISDFRLPGRLDGIQLLDAIQRRAAKPISAVLLTGDTSPNQIDLSASSNWNVLFKPVDLPKLLSMMSMIEKTGHLRRRERQKRQP